MWIKEIINALQELNENRYGQYSCCVEYIRNNIITMSNGDKWVISSEGVKQVEREGIAIQ